jgi:hypothetical protein
MVTFDFPVRRPGITKPFYVILLDKKMVDLVSMDSWSMDGTKSSVRIDTSHDPCPRLGQFNGKLRRKYELVKPKDCVELAPTKVILRYTKRPAYTITIWSIGIVIPATHAETTVGIGPNQKDVSTAGYKASPNSVGVFFVFSLRFAAVGRIRTHEEQDKWVPTRRAVET